jgi:radical SAM/Cys-rich protein
MKTMVRRGVALSSPSEQLAALRGYCVPVAAQPRFADKLGVAGLFPLRPTGIDTLQINLGKLCNQTCRHCHVDAGPDRREVMSRETMSWCLRALQQTDIRLVDLTGGAPEMNPDFRWLVGEIYRLGREVMVRSNLTILLAGHAYEDLPEFFARHRAHIVSSLPYFTPSGTDRQRGAGVFDKSIVALRRLNAAGYGRSESGLLLDLVYNPTGAFLPGPQQGLEADFKRELMARFGIEFNRLFAITNLPVSRFLEYLVDSGNLEGYLDRLIQAFNPAAARGVMCRNLISVGWDGTLYDCDFNQMLELGVEASAPAHIRDFDLAALNARAITVDQHCFGCTAGQGSSCGGSTA